MHIYKKILLFVLGIYFPVLAVTAFGFTNWLTNEVEQYQAQSLSKGHIITAAVLKNSANELQNLLDVYSKSLFLDAVVDKKIKTLIQSPIESSLSLLSYLQQNEHAGQLHQLSKNTLEGSISNLVSNSLIASDFRQPAEGEALRGIKYLWRHNKPYMLAIMPLQSEQPRHYLILVRTLTPAYLNALFETTSIINQVIISSSPGIGTPQSTLVSRIELQGISNSAPLFAHVELSGFSFQPLRQYLDLLPWVIITCGLALLLPIILWLKNGIMTPLKQLSSALKEINEDANNLKELTTTGSVEFSELATEIRSLLGSNLQQRKRANLTLASITDAIFITDKQAQLTYLNPQAKQLINIKVQIALTQELDDLLTFEHKLTAQLIESMQQSGRNFHTDKVKLNTQPPRLIERHISNLLNHENQVIGSITLLKDITQSELLKCQLRRRANYDSATGLLNRSTFEQQLPSYTQNAKQVSACYLAVNQIKQINAECGRQASDAMLTNIAQSMGHTLKEKGLLARLGDDEFGLILCNCSAHHTSVILKQLTQKVAETTVAINDNHYDIDFSIGVALGQGGESVLTLLRAADEACINAKQQDGNQIAFSRSSNDKLILYCEPIQTISPAPQDERLAILARMLSPNGSITLPTKIASYSGQLHLEKRLVTQSFSWLATHQAYWGNPCFSINISAKILSDQHMVDFILLQTKHHQILPTSLCFELSEINSIIAVDKALNQLKRLSLSGFTFALDNLGASSAPYIYLKALPVTYVKIDGELISALHNSSRAEELVKSLHQVCYGMGIATLANNVNSQACLEQLKAMGIHYAQGSAVGQPQPLEQYLNLQNTRAC